MPQLMLSLPPRATPAPKRIVLTSDSPVCRYRAIMVTLENVQDPSQEDILTDRAERLLRMMTPAERQRVMA